MTKSSSKPYVQVYTFGQPRVGNLAFVKPIRDKVDELYRIVHNRDFGTHFPFWVPNFQSGCSHEGPLPFYPYHVAGEIYYDELFENYQECSQTDGEDPNCTNSKLIISLLDHLYYFGIKIDSLYQ